MTRQYETVIGLEIHAQLMTETKAFCQVANEFGLGENTRVGPVSGGLPGALPVLNDQAVRLAVRAGLALNCAINKESIFSRKNYFYPDLPKGYQISQFDKPVCGEGWIDILVGEKGAETKKIGIERIHMEEDAGKSVHLANYTLVNLNRSGVPLVEIVSHPDMRSAAEAVAYLKKIHSILVFAEICDGNLEEGNFRCDVNISIRPVGQKELGTRTELKNINSFRFVEKSIEYETARQIAVVEGGGIVIQETRGWDSAAGKTLSQRKKEEAHDYRYFPEPDLPPLVLSDEYIEEVRENMPELPEAKKERFKKKYTLSDYDAEQLTSDVALSAYYEDCIRRGAPAKKTANWLLSEVLKELKKLDDVSVSDSPVGPKALTELVQLIEEDKISGKIAKTVLEEMFATGKSADTIVEEKGLVQVLDTSAIDAWVDQVIGENPKIIEDYQSGKTKVFGFLVGQVMKLSQGKANPSMASKALKKKIDV